MRRAWVGLLLAGVALALVCCGGEGASEAADVAPEAAQTEEAAAPVVPAETERTARCSATRFRVSFLQADQVRVETGERVLAFASYTDRGVDASCPEKPPEFSYADGALGEGVYEDVELSCSAPGPIEIHVHPIRYGSDTGPVVGSSLTVSDLSVGDPRTIVGAVLKNREEASIASRIYFAPKYCQAA
jgi:hypothetical protein